jgi:hypothetical protein
MKKMFKLFMCAAVVAAGFTACSEEVNPIGPESGGTTETGVLTVKFANPTTYADEEKAIPFESNVKDVTILAFNSAGACKVNTTIDKDKLTPDGNGGYKATIEVPVEQLNVFAGINLKSGTINAMIATLETQYGFDKAINLGTVTEPSLAAIRELSAPNAFAMFSDNFKHVNVDPNTSNPVSLSLDRMVAKITVRKKSTFDDADNYKADGAIFAAPNTLADVTWAMGNLNGKIYPYAKANEENGQDPNYDNKGQDLKIPTGGVVDYVKENFINEFKTPNDNYGAWDTDSFVVVDASDKVVNERRAKYAPENNSLKKRKGESTFTAIKAKFAPEKTYTFDASSNTVPQEVASYTPNLGQNLPYYVVRASKTYYFADKPQADAYVTFLTGAGQSAKVETYLGQYCFYHVFMIVNDVRVTNRNNYYDLTLNKFNGLGTPTGEIDEEDVDDIDNAKASLDVTISVKDWTWIEGDSDLEK